MLLHSHFIGFIDIKCKHFSNALRDSSLYIRPAETLALNACWCRSETRKFEKRNHNGGHNNFLLNCNIACNKQTTDVALTASRFSHAFLQENFTSKRWFWFRVEARNFTKNKLLEVVNLTKINFVFAGLTPNWITAFMRL